MKNECSKMKIEFSLPLVTKTSSNIFSYQAVSSEKLYKIVNVCA